MVSARRIAWRWHPRLAWIGGVAIVLWGLSGLLHPVIVWTGPEPATRAAPSAEAALPAGPAPSELLAAAGIGQANNLRLVAEDGRFVLQVDRLDARRVYLPLDGSAAPTGLDRRRAIRLARHYAGNADAAVVDATLVTAFDDLYPQVNRLLPVWRVTLDLPGAPMLWVDTGDGALAQITDRRKRTLQSAFQLLHSWRTLEQVPALRAVAIGVPVGAALLTMLAGLGMALSGARGKGTRRWHRRIGFFAVLPVLLYTCTGLVQMAWSLSRPGVATALPVFATDRLTGAIAAWLDHLPEGSVRGAVLVADGDRLLWRVQLGADAGGGGSADPHAHHGGGSNAASRFEGAGPVAPVMYADAADGSHVDLDEALAAHRVAAASALAPAGARPGPATMVRQFTAEYGFADKKLPVWRVGFDDAAGSALFVDPARALVVKRVDRIDRTAGWLFSMLHKWDWLPAFIGRPARDVFVSLLVVAALCAAGFGWVLQWRRRRRGL